MRKGIQIKTIRNLNLDHPGGKCQILTIRGGNEGNEQAILDQVRCISLIQGDLIESEVMPSGYLGVKFPFPPQMVKIWHFPPGWSRFRFLTDLIQNCLLVFLNFPPDGQDLAFPPRMVKI